jgi:hypothetical protein
LRKGNCGRVTFDLRVGLASDRGAFFEGAIRSAGTGGTPRPTTPPPPGVQPPPLPPLPPETGPGFGLTIPIGKSLGPLTVHNLQLRFGSEDVDGKKTYLLQAASSISMKLGPVMARVDRAGLKFGVRIPDEDTGEKGNLGFADVDVGAVLPNGVSLAIDVKGYVTGGGFLYHDKVQQVYAGVFELTVKERITVKAFGLIATKMPDGSKGYSLIVFITAEGFQPIPIGMAAMLRGIGGMVAINRTFDEEAMRAGLRNKTLGTLLFPKDPIRNAPEIIRNLITTFPAEDGAYLFGLLMKITWFSPTLVYLDVAIMVEVGNRLRVIVLGMISALLPTRENDLVRLNMDALGLLDLGKMSIAVDAVLVDSRLAQKFVLTGDMALRASMAPGRRNFVMAVGGFNPRFAPPENFPTLKRITIALASGNNPRLTCEAYFAITSNTIQFGARAELYAAAFGFSIEGDIGFDVLIHLLPFHLIADFKASVQLKRGSRSLFKLSVSGSLEGPRPLRISGKASFEIFWCDFTIRFDKTLISGEKPPLPPGVDVFAELRRALTAPDAWSTQQAQNRQHGVSLRKIAAGTTLVLDPLGNLVVKQQVVPLNTSRDLDTFGGAPIAGVRSFKLQASIEGVTQDVNNVQDAFAPGQFFEMTDDEKLASPSFEDMDAGAIFGSDAIVIDEGASIFAPLEFETIIIDEQGLATNEVEDRYVLVAHRFFEQVRFSAVGTAPVPQHRRSALPQSRSTARGGNAQWTVRDRFRCGCHRGTLGEAGDIRRGAGDVASAQSRRGRGRGLADPSDARDGGVVSDVSRSQRQRRVPAVGPPGCCRCDQRVRHARREHAWRSRSQGDAGHQQRAGRSGHGAPARPGGRRRHRSERDRAGRPEAEHDRLRAELLPRYRVRPGGLPVVVHAGKGGREREAAAVVVPGRRASAGRRAAQQLGRCAAADSEHQRTRETGR